MQPDDFLDLDAEDVPPDELDEDEPVAEDDERWPD